MALHLRDQIMDALGTLLTGLTTTAARVYLDRDDASEPLSAAELPGLTIVQVSEASDVHTLGQPRLLAHALDVDVVAHVKLGTNTLARKQLNLIDKEVQTAIAGLLGLGVGAKYTTKIQTDFDTVGDAEKPIARARFRYQVFYLSFENAPDVAG